MNIIDFINGCMRFIYSMVIICGVLTVLTFIGTWDITLRHTLFLLAVALLTVIGNRIFINDRRYMALLVRLGLAGCSLFIITLLTGTALEYWQVNTYIGFWCGLSNIMIFIMALVPDGQAGCWLKWVLLMLMLMPVMMVWTHYAATGLWEDDIIMANFLQLDFAEGIRMLFNGTGFFAGLLLLTIWIGGSYMLSGGGRLIFERLTAGTLIGCILFLMLNSALIYRSRENIVMEHVYQAQEILVNMYKK